MAAVDVAVVEAPLDKHGSGDAGRRGVAAQGQLLLVNLSRSVQIMDIGEGSVITDKWKRMSVEAPSRGVPSLSVFLPKDIMCHHGVMLWRDMMSWGHAVKSLTSVDMTKWTCTDHTIRKSENHVFQNGDFDLWPMSLTFQLIQNIVRFNPSTKARVCM